MEDVDIYADLPSIHIEEHENSSENDNENQLSEKAKVLEKELTELRSKLEKLQGLNNNLKTNFSSLIKTAKTEISRKDRTINELRSKLDNITFRRNQRQNNRPNSGFNNVNNGFNEYNNYTDPQIELNQQMLVGDQEFQAALQHQFSYPPPPLPMNIPTSDQYQYQNQSLYPSPPVDAEVAYTEPEYTEKEDFKPDIKQKYFKKELKGSSDEEDDEFINKSHYVSTVYGERLRKRLMQEKENEERKKQEELKLSKEKENEKRKTDNELKIPEENKQIKLNKIEFNIAKEPANVKEINEKEKEFQDESKISKQWRSQKHTEESQICLKQNDLKLIECNGEVEKEPNELMQIKEKEVQKLDGKHELKKESKDLDKVIDKKEIRTRQSQRIEEKASKMEAMEKESPRMKEEVSKGEVKERESQKLNEKIDTIEIQKGLKTFEEIVNNNETKTREFQRFKEKISKYEIIESKSFDKPLSKWDLKENDKKAFVDGIQNTCIQSQIHEVKYSDKRTGVEELNIVERTITVNADSEKDKLNNKENLSFANKQLNPMDTFVNVDKTEDSISNFENSDIPKIETNLIERDEFSYSKEGPSYINNRRYSFSKSNKYWNSNNNDMHSHFKNYPNNHYSKNNNFRHKSHRHENYQNYHDYNHHEHNHHDHNYHDHNYHNRHKNKYYSQTNSRYSRQDYCKMEKYDRNKSSDRDKSRHRESSSSSHRHREYEFNNAATNLESKYNRTPKKLHKKDKKQKSSEKKKKHKDKTPKKSPKRKMLLDSENELAPKFKRRKTEITDSVNTTHKSNLIDPNVPLLSLISIPENLLKKEEIYETLEEGEITDSLDSALESTNLNVTNAINVAKTETNIEPIAEKVLDIQESNRIIEKILVDKESVKLPETDNINRLIIENITNQITKGSTSKLEKPKNQENEKIERVQEISSLYQQLKPESIDSNKLNKQTNLKGDPSEILNSDLYSNNRIDNNIEKDLNKKIINSEKIHSASPKNKMKIDSNKNENRNKELHRKELDVKNNSLEESLKGTEIKTPKKKTKKESNEEKKIASSQQDKVKMKHASPKKTNSSDNKKDKTPSNNVGEDSNKQEDNNVLQRKAKEQMKNPALEKTENNEGKEVISSRKNVKDEFNVQVDNNVIPRTEKVNEQMKNSDLDEIENTEEKQVKSLRKNTEKVCNQIEVKDSSKERTKSTPIKDLKTPRKKVKKESRDHNCRSSKKLKKEDEIKNVSLEEIKIFEDIAELPRKKAKKESNKEEDGKDEITNTFLEESVNTEYNELITPRKKPNNESNNQEQKKNIIMQKEMDEVKNTSFKEIEGTKDVEVKIHKTKVQKDSDKPQHENCDNLPEEKNQIKNTTQEEHNSEINKIVVTNTKEIQQDNFTLKKKSIKDSKVKKKATKKTEDPNIMKKQLMKSLFGSESPVSEKIVDSHSYKRTIILPKNAKNIIFVKRRRRPVQLSDSPPVVVVDHAKSNPPT